MLTQVRSHRPIISGTLVSKTVLRAVLATPAAERAVERVAPYLLSLGVSRGVEKLIHSGRAAYGSNWLVGRNDFANEFNSMCRQKMLESHCDLLPKAPPLSIFSMAQIPLFFFQTVAICS